MIASHAAIPWTEANQAYLVSEFARLKRLLGSEDQLGEKPPPAERPFAIERICELFELTAFERHILLLCAGVEMDSKLAELCGVAQGYPQRVHATFGLAMATHSDPHWSALSPDAPLRRLRLVEVETGHGLAQGLTTAPLRIDERILHYLAGVNVLDSRLSGLLEPAPFPEWIAESHKPIAARVSAAVTTETVLHLCGDDSQGQEDVAALASRDLGRQLFILRVEDLPAPGPDLDRVLLLWQREARLLPGVLLIQCGSSGLSLSARRLAERLVGPLMLAGREPVRLNRAFLRLDVDKPSAAEQRDLWGRALAGREPLRLALDALSEQFRLSAKTIFSTAARAEPENLWNVCRGLARPRLEDLAQRIVPCAGWEDLVLPELQIKTLRQLASQVRHRMRVYETWDFAGKGRRGLGLSALFAGESGTGKTLAAEVLARELELDLYRIDLSAVVSKYIGETEKNLKQVFDAAEEGGVLLLFDEADALFGKRSDVKDSHDRYANIEVSYLLQRMEAYQGLAILTTNLKSALDQAFQRRLRFTVNFPFPGAAQREAIWRRMFPAKTPVQGLDPKKLSQLNVTGGHIRNIALNAAFLAAETGEPVQMNHVLEAARLEAHKMERALSEAEIRGWV
ncbi:MAG TPA: ATP-binding protein [Bryobacteraceae bacterium]